MKRLLTVLLLLSLLPALAGCGGGGDTQRVRLEIRAAGDYDAAEVRAAMNAAMRAFEKAADDCVLLRLRFDAGYSDAWLAANDIEPNGEMLILLINYRDEDGTEQSGIPWPVTKSAQTWRAVWPPEA